MLNVECWTNDKGTKITKIWTLNDALSKLRSKIKPTCLCIWKLKTRLQFYFLNLLLRLFSFFSLSHFFHWSLDQCLFFIYLLIIARMFIALSSLWMPDAQSINYNYYYFWKLRNATCSFFVLITKLNIFLDEWIHSS